MRRSEVAALRSRLAAELPEHMLPSAFVALAAFPLTPNGKLDRAALPAPDAAAVLTRTFAPPQGPIETAIATLWCDLLGLDRVGRHDHFFELGGHSLLVVTLIERLRQQGLVADVRAVFAAPVLADLAAAIGSAAPTQRIDVPPNRITPECTAITPDLLPLVSLTQAEIDGLIAAVPGGVTNIQDIYPLAPLQEGILFHHLLQHEGDAYLLRSLIAFDTRDRLDRFLPPCKPSSTATTSCALRCTGTACRPRCRSCSVVPRCRSWNWPSTMTCARRCWHAPIRGMSAWT